MATKALICDISSLDFDHPLADIDEIRKHNPQRYEMEQLTAILSLDVESGICIGYKDVSEDSFWVRGHMPDMPLMPGVLMLEAVAQQCSFHASKEDLIGEGVVVGFGGVEHCRFRGPVKPNDRLILITKMVKVRPRRMIVSEFQGVVDDKVVVDGTVRGIALPVQEIVPTPSDS